ncbi:DUF6273 domain-containing protein [Kineothrix sedimenti]|uniref:DUF6273 domain-containing protein n=1 Tax=Kineothrix sedimenti TaxID=3123317 RepID=A0ABZ3F1W7_9FIRM
MQITVNETDMKIEGNRLVININSDLGKVLGLNKVVLSSVKPGDIINDKYIVLEHFESGATAVIRKELLEKTMDFGDSNNDWRSSNVRNYLNNEYLKDVEKEFGADSIVEHMVDLLSMDGLDDYGSSRDKISLLTIDQYRKYRKILGDNMKNWWWLATPDSTPSGWSTGYVRCVDSSGGVCYDGYICDGGVRPFFILKSSIFVSSPRD